MSNKDVYSSFYFTKDTTVVNYVPKKNKNVVLMSTLHRNKAISDMEKKKPQIILDQNNATKEPVDTLDQFVNTYTCKRKTNHWPMIVFYDMVDITAYNAFVLWTSINPGWNENKLTRRRLFLKELGKSLISAHIDQENIRQELKSHLRLY